MLGWRVGPDGEAGVALKMLEASPGAVCVVVVTFNRKDLLRRCLHSLRPSIREGDVILVVDNASTDGTGAMLDAEFSDLARLNLPLNVGGAGGFHDGMQWGYERGYSWLWLMDDDGVAAPNCLAHLLKRADSGSVMVPVQKDSGGRFYGVSIWRRRNIEITAEILSDQAPRKGRYLFTFVGPLIPRAVIDQIGLPNAAFFIWFDDFEYSLRITEQTEIFVEVVPEAVFFHDMGENARVVRFLGLRSIRSDVAAWKIYYGVRNQLFTLIHTRRNPNEVLLFGLVHVRLLCMDAFYGPERLKRIGYRVRGTLDGVLGRLGKRT